MKLSLCMTTAIVLLTAPFFLSSARADEEKVPLDKIPQPILDAVRERGDEAVLPEDG